MKQWYEELFTNYAKRYDKEQFTKGTINEVDFIEEEIGLDKSKSILDVGCGTGRHSIELAKRGYDVTGIDLSDSQLNMAKLKAEQQKLNVTFLKRDARDFQFDDKFDVAIMLCEGAFSLMETDEMNYKILKNVTNSLSPNGTFIFTCLNVLFPLYHSVKDFINQGCDVYSKENTFDVMTFRDYSVIEVIDDDGVKKRLECNERYFAPAEIHWMLIQLGFTNIHIGGCDTGVFDRKRKLLSTDYEMLVVAEK